MDSGEQRAGKGENWRARESQGDCDGTLHCRVIE